MDLAMRSFQNGTLDLPMLSRGYGTLPSYTSRLSFPIDLEKLVQPKKLPRLYPPTQTIIPTIPSNPNVNSISQTPPREARPYGEQVPT